MSVFLARPNSGKNHIRRLCTKKDAPAKQHGIWPIYLQAQEIRTKLRSILLLKQRWCRHLTSTRPEEREFVVDSGASMHMMSKKELSSEEMGDSEEVQNPYCGIDCQWRSANPPGGASVCSRSKSVRNRATTWGNACRPIARQVLRRPRILQWVGQRSKATIDQRWEEYYLRDGQLRTSWFWARFVFYIAVTGLLEKGGGNSSWKQHATCFKFRFSIGGKWRNISRKLVRPPKK